MLLARFLRNQKGGVAPMLALGIIPLIGTVGAAVDYSRASSTRTAMQAALDSTALMLSRDAQTLNAAQLDSKATAYFNALFHRPEASNVQVQQQFSSPQQGSFNIKVTGSATVNTMFWRLIGQDQVNITASGEIVWGIKKLNLALALDNTGSMASSNKMTALKEAAHNLLNTLQKAEKTPGDIKVSIIPFAVDVNVGTEHVNASWIDWEEWDAKNGTCSKSSYNNKSSCTQQQRHLDAQGPQPVERLRDGSRPEQRRQRNPDRRRRRGQLPRPSGVGMSGGDDAAVHRLDGAERQDRRDDPDRQHQRHDRNADGVADADGGGAVQCARAGARPRQGDHPADRRSEHPEPLDLEHRRRSTRARRRSATTPRPPTSRSTPCA